MAAEGEIQRDSSAPEILAALRQLQSDLLATRADIRTLAERPSAGAGATTTEGAAAVSQEVERTTGALNEESAARDRNVALARDELAAQREITLEIQRTAVAYAKLSETHAGTTVTANSQVAQTEAAVAAQSRAKATPAIVPAPAITERAARPPTAGLSTYGEELTNVSARQAEFSTAQAQGGAANAHFTAQLLKGDVTLGEFGANLATTAGKFAQWTAAAGGVFAVIGIFDEVYKGARDSSSGVSQLQRSIDGLDTEKAQSDFRALAHELNIPIAEASDAVFKFSRTFPELDQAVAAAGTGLRAQKVDNVDLATSVRALTAVHQQFGVSAEGLSGKFDMLDEGQRRYNARVGDTLAVLSKSSAAVKDAGGNLDQLIQLATYASRVVGQPGNQIGTAFYRAASNTVQNPSNQSIIKSLGLNPDEAANDFTNFLITAIRKSASEGGQWKRELAIAIGGKQQGGKVFEPLLSGNANLLNEIIGNVTPDKARGSTQEELGRILEQTDERVKSLKNSLQQMGAELQRAGATAGLGLVLVTLQETLNVTNNLLDAFNVLPHPVKELILVLLEAKLAIAGLRATALGAGLANATGLSVLGPTPAQQAARSERAAQESALASVTGLQGATLVREQQLRTQALVNEQQVAILREEEAGAATAEERLAIKQRIEGLEAESVALSQEGNLLLTEQAAQQEVANGLQARINALRAGAVAGPASAAGGVIPIGVGGAATAEKASSAAVSDAEIAGLVGGGAFAKLASLPELLSTGLSLAFKGIGVAILGEIAAQVGGQVVGGSLGKSISSIGGDAAIGAGIGAVVGPIGVPFGAAGGAAFGLGQTAGRAIFGGYTRKEEEEIVAKRKAEREKREEVQKAQVRQSEKGTRPSEIGPPGLRKALADLERGEAERAAPFNTFSDLGNQNPKQAQETIATAALKSSTTGRSAAGLRQLTEELINLSGRYSGGEDKEGLAALQEAESKLLESAKKSAQGLADKASVDPSRRAKGNDYRASLASLDAAIRSVQQGYRLQKQKVEQEEAKLRQLEAQRSAEAGGTTPRLTPGRVSSREQQIAQLKRTIEANKLEFKQIKSAAEYETNQLRIAREQQAEAAFSDITSSIEASTGLAEARTSDKSAQLRAALQGDNEKLKLAAELFGKESNQYKKALSDVLKQQQAIVEQTVASIGTQGKLEASEIGGSGQGAELGRAKVGIDTSKKQLEALKAGHADPEKIKETQTQINEAENSMASTVQSSASSLASLAGQLAQAKDAGNAIAIAKDAADTASKLLSLASSPEDRLQAQIALVQAQNQLQQAEEQHIADLGAFAESKELNPLARDKTKLRTDRRQLAKAKGPDERLKDRTELNNDLTKFRQDQRSESEEEVSFLLHIGKITNTQAAERIKKLLATKGLSKAERRKLESEAFDLTAQAEQDFAVGSIAHVPTLYDASTLGPGRAGVHATITHEHLHQPTQLHQHNTIAISVAGGKPGQFAKEMERVFGTLTRSQLRSAGLA